MSNWDRSDLGYEDYDPNKDYSVQVQRNDGGLASTQVCTQGCVQCIASNKFSGLKG